MSSCFRLEYLAFMGVLAICGQTLGGNNPPFNAELIGQWSGLGGSNADVWGDGDFAYLAGFGESKVGIVDVSDPANPVGIVYQLPPPFQGASAQDVKVGDGLLFVGLGSTNEGSAHIVDVRDPMNPVALVDVIVSGFTGIHNLFYDSGFLYLTTSGATRVAIVDLTELDPDNPPDEPIIEAKWVVESIGKSFVHDMTVVDGRMYAAAWDSGLWIYDVSNVATQMPTFLGQTPDGGNNTHSSWPTSNGDFVVTGEERTGGGIKVYRITDTEGSLTLELTDSLALPEGDAFSVHNQLIDGYRLYDAWYGAGLLVHDIDPETGTIELFASYDTPGSNWGVYPLLGQNRILLSDISFGLYVVQVGMAATTPDSFSAFRGFLDSGTLDDVLESDDSDLCHNPGIVLNPAEAPITLDFVGILPSDSPATLDVTIESSANTVGLELTISFWNYNTNSWDVVGTDMQSLNSDTVRTFAGTPADHVEAGTGEVRTRYEVRVVSFIFLFPWTDCVDQVFWTIG